MIPRSLLSVLLLLFCKWESLAAFCPTVEVVSRSLQNLPKTPTSSLSSDSSRTAQTSVNERFPTCLSSSSQDNESNNDKKKKGALETGLRTKLLSESIAPWRTVRLFLYGSLGSGAAVGGFITLTGTLAALSGARTDVDLNSEFLNLAIDFGAVAVFAILAKFDLDNQAELNTKVEEKMERKKEQKKIAKGMKEREQQLGSLQLDIQVSADGATRQAGIRELQAGARQNMILVAGPRKACRDALVGANLLKINFAMKNVLVVPYDIDEAASSAAGLEAGAGSGFGERPTYETQPYVARPAGDMEAWREYIESEIRDAVQQNGEKARQEGIAIVVADNGKIIRRGIGKVPWRQMVEQLDQFASGATESQ